MNQQPAIIEYPEFYHKYISQVRHTDILAALSSQLNTTLDLLNVVPDDKWEFSYAPNKWTLKVSWIHVIDTERVFAYRALRIGRGDSTPLASFDQNLFVANLDATHRTPTSILEEYQAVRAATIHLFKHFGNEELLRMGTLAAGVASTRAIGFMIAGHELHHLQLTKEKYLS
ncbi:MAG: DinB family protein [Saprospiraceae bacterium]|nr:DinB family protein [Saprospiraceae bacterium]